MDSKEHMMDSILYNIRVNPLNIGGRDVYVNDAVRDLISSHPAFTDRELIEKKIDDSFRHLNSKMVDVISFRNRMNENFSTLDKRIHSAIERNKFIEKQNEELIKECRRKDVDIAHLNERNTSLLKSYQYEENQRRDWKEKADKANTRSLIFFLVGLGIAVSWFILR